MNAFSDFSKPRSNTATTTVVFISSADICALIHLNEVLHQARRGLQTPPRQSESESDLPNRPLRLEHHIVIHFSPAP
ncbi:hypothetical protein PROFUN_03744 [Planoprotostelium fungivorum]|uniref:Uncharacterized protein n=1 Tax=Planoprotostelium fungivorum TaxID=1890364 RepID=A0A2P6NDL4_9EUKA|nr:hypothetical protein PROFUN_03744 [Planoprotostelium fungivorum]